MSAAQPLLRLTGVSKAYPGFQLQDINLELPPGCILGFVGPNGAGKTTTIRIITNLVRPDGGRVEVLGRTWDRDEVAIKSRLGYVPEDNPIIPPGTTPFSAPCWKNSMFPAIKQSSSSPRATVPSWR
ncbi:MAG: type transport system ATP-binding protein [Moorella sp. (in: firmicutes)]|nr:type transport system ATP-binding protein [Moorella sp. (in: firmicutes)]